MHALPDTFRPQHGLYNYYGDLMVLEVFCDSDWATNKCTRKSVSACCMMLHGCLLHSSSRTQRTIVLSSGKAESYAATSGGCDAVLLRECLLFLFPGDGLDVKLFIDCSAVLAGAFWRGKELAKSDTCQLDAFGCSSFVSVVCFQFIP